MIDRISSASSSRRGRTPLIVLALIAGTVFGFAVASDFQTVRPSIAATQDDGEVVGAAATAQRVEADAVRAIGSFADLAEAALPAVATIRATTIRQTSSRDGVPEDFFQRFFRSPDGQRDPRFRFQQPPPDQRDDGSGSGFVVSPDGWVVTNNHVIDEATKVVVLLGEREYEAEVRGQDPETDLALLKVDAGTPLPYLALGDSRGLRAGDWVMAIGSPLGYGSSVTVGVVSAKGRSIGITGPDSSFENFIQTDAAINRGNSGGPLVNTAGEVVGISTAMNYGAENIGFAVPVDTLKQILPQLRDDGRVRRGYLGVNIRDLQYRDMEAFGVESTDGALVTIVRNGTPAEKAGLEPGDIIVRVDEHEVERNRDLIDYVSGKAPGDKVRVEVWRDRVKVE
ncbi:MAG: trypsin-like peptidase domain-containing protein, partial [Acidobacteriota bacterium]